MEKNKKKWMITRSTPMTMETSKSMLRVNILKINKTVYFHIDGANISTFFGVNQENSVCTNKMWKCQPKYNYEIVIRK